MWTRPPLLLIVTTLAILPGSQLVPLNVVFQPVTYQLTPMGVVDPDFTPVFPSPGRGSSEAPEESNQLICKKIQHGEALYRVSPSTQARYLVFIPSPALQSFTESPFLRFFVAVPSVSPGGITSADDLQTDIPEGAFAAPPPLISSLCVSQDSPRPFPVLFAPPPPSQFGLVDNDFRREMSLSAFDKLFSSPATDKPQSPLKVSLDTPSVGGVTLGIHGVPATVESSSPSRDAPAGKILVKLHTNPPGSITMSLTGDSRMLRTTDSPGTDYETFRGSSVLASSPSVSLVFSRPVGSVGIASANSPAVNIEKQSIVSPATKSPMNTEPVDWMFNKKKFYYF